MASIALRGLKRHFPGAARAALEGLDLEVASGELLVFVGPSGCGKSTALRLVAGLDTPDAGSILLDGRDVSRVPPQERDVAMVFQGYALYPHMTVAENMGFPLKMRGVSREARAKRVEEVAGTLGLAGLLGRRPGELSGGERQRVAMGRAIVRSPKVFLFDEPLSNLDAALRTELRVELAAMVRRLGTTSIYVTHDQVEAMTMGDRIAVMRAGALLQVGAPRVIYEDPEDLFVAGFLGSPAINQVAVRREGDRYVAEGGALSLPAGTLGGEQLVAAVRPEHVRVLRSDEDAEKMACVVRGRVTVAEPLGAETFVYLEAGALRLRARARGFAQVTAGDVVQVGLETGAVLWFDPLSGARVRPVSGA
ncbi:ABC transporter ATP-binding protein [Chondromyces crocatus]|uniref:Sugar ABC transporter ATP-binding protein n=1 Tax=Chondromyces crocatus TaxID=52 RepID=A0A0K1E8T0_CHOCO|nr:ABC transporter ATP-binding protein [Chondromyces crocatus]AKT36988.1 sugar ABC transporter ATP-binding protein [Chondromyces crocatus]